VAFFNLANINAYNLQDSKTLFVAGVQDYFTLTLLKHHWKDAFSAKLVRPCDVVPREMRGDHKEGAVLSEIASGLIGPMVLFMEVVRFN